MKSISIFFKRVSPRILNPTLSLVFLIQLFSSFACNSPGEDGLLVPLLVTQDASLPSIKIGGVQLHSETRGDPGDPMLVVLHGGPGGDYRGILNFESIADDGYFVIFFDQRGAGLSERLQASSFPDVQIFLTELQGVIDHYRTSDTQKLFIAGHSWGAMLASAYINQNPTKVSGAVIIEPGGLTWPQTRDYIARSQNVDFFGEQTNDFVYQDQLITGQDHNVLDYKFALSTAEDIDAAPKAPPFWRLGYVSQQRALEIAQDDPDQLNFTTNLKEFENKVLFVYSEENTAYGKEHAADVSSAFKNIDLVEIKGVGHEIVHFAWDALEPKIIAYLKEVNP